MQMQLVHNNILYAIYCYDRYGASSLSSKASAPLEHAKLFSRAFLALWKKREHSRQTKRGKEEYQNPRNDRWSGATAISPAIATMTSHLTHEDYLRIVDARRARSRKSSKSQIQIFIHTRLFPYIIM